MKKKKIINRKCCFCQKIFNREELIKITLDYKTNELVINPSSKIQGRSVYICQEKSCIDGAFKKKRIFKALKKCINKNLKEEEEKIKAVLESILVLKLY